ncbi:MAG: amidase [Proteobacteria bacterium]|nr:amidase [Pseudomonadota bacterium]
MSLCEAAGAIRDGRLTSLRATEACLARIERWQPRLNAFIAIEAEEALAMARARDMELAEGRVRGPLHGVPLAHKDMFYRQGKVSTGGSKIRRNWVADRTATVIERLAAAGAVQLGTLHMVEFAAGPTGHNDHLGDCRNPWNPAHMTGGSSSGSGASVAARLVFGAMGSDTGGSVRLPACACGVVGIKVTQGRISRYGCLPRVWSQDCMGPLTRTARDCARMTGVIAGADPKDPTASAEPVPDYEAGLEAGIAGLRVGVPAAHFDVGVDAEVRAALDQSLEVFRSLGAEIVRVDVPDPRTYYDLADTISKCEGTAVHAQWMQERGADYSPQVYARQETGFHIPAVRYIEALMVRGRLLAEFVEAAFARADLLHIPSIPIPIPTRADTDVRDSGGVPQLLATITRYTRPINYLGVPALNVPCGFSKSGLPIGMQLVGRPYAEGLLFRAAHAYQSATDWHEWTPTI